MSENEKENIEQYAKKLVNDPLVEFAWAEKALNYAEIHMKLLSSVSDLSKLKLSPIDDVIYGHFRKVSKRSLSFFCTLFPFLTFLWSVYHFFDMIYLQNFRCFPT
jgi:hypothetical protein